MDFLVIPYSHTMDSMDTLQKLVLVVILATSHVQSKSSNRQVNQSSLVMTNVLTICDADDSDDRAWRWLLLLCAQHHNRAEFRVRLPGWHCLVSLRTFCQLLESGDGEHGGGGDQWHHLQTQLPQTRVSSYFCVSPAPTFEPYSGPSWCTRLLKNLKEGTSFHFNIVTYTQSSQH